MDPELSITKITSRGLGAGAFSEMGTLDQALQACEDVLLGQVFEQLSWDRRVPLENQPLLVRLNKDSKHRVWITFVVSLATKIMLSKTAWLSQSTG